MAGGVAGGLHTGKIVGTDPKGIPLFKKGQVHRAAGMIPVSGMSLDRFLEVLLRGTVEGGFGHLPVASRITSVSGSGRTLGGGTGCSRSGRSDRMDMGDEEIGLSKSIRSLLERPMTSRYSGGSSRVDDQKWFSL
jgi:hypothetical protein